MLEVALHAPRHAKVRELGGARRVEEDVGALDVAVDDGLVRGAVRAVVEIVERLRHLDGALEPVDPRHRRRRRAVQARLERPAGEVLVHEALFVALGGVPQQPHEARVPQPGEHLELRQEFPLALAAAALEALDGDAAEAC